MNIYTATYEATKPTPKAITVPLNSKYGIGIEVEKDGIPIELKQDSLSLNGMSADDAYANIAIFKLSSDDNEGREVYEVAGTGAGGGIDYTLSVDETWTVPAGETPSATVDLADWAGVEIVLPHGNQSYNWTAAELAEVPFYAYKVSDGVITEAKCQTWFYDKSTDQPIGYIQKTGRSSSQKLRWTQFYWDLSSEVDSDRFVIPSNCYCKLMGGAGGEIHLKATYTKTTPLPVFKLFIDKKDNSTVEGYGDDYIFKNTITLSGTNEDDSEFSYTLPTII